MAGFEWYIGQDVREPNAAAVLSRPVGSSAIPYLSTYITAVGNFPYGYDVFPD